MDSRLLPLSRKLVLFCLIASFAISAAEARVSRFFAGLAPQRSAVLIETSAGVRVQGPGSPPQPGFACCEHGIAQMQALFADPSVIPALKDLHAEVAVPVADFAPERAAPRTTGHRRLSP